MAASVVTMSPFGISGELVVWAIGGDDAAFHTLLALRAYSDVPLAVPVLPSLLLPPSTMYKSTEMGAPVAVDVGSDVGSGDGDVCFA